MQWHKGDIYSLTVPGVKCFSGKLVLSLRVFHRLPHRCHLGYSLTSRVCWGQTSLTLTCGCGWCPQGCTSLMLICGYGQACSPRSTEALSKNRYFRYRNRLRDRAGLSENVKALRENKNSYTWTSRGEGVGGGGREINGDERKESGHGVVSTQYHADDML